MSAVSPLEDKGEEGDAMKEELRRVFGESTEEDVERERRGGVGEEAVRARARKTEAVPSLWDVEEHHLLKVSHTYTH